ncbi:VanZ family protein [Bacillus sp. AFS077874]|uniref:VanZ family protein n=1 Tax=Bacillus sp. AFS077874 TaxID=2033513 RepID=UPI000BF9E95E|nr:VanZ family protein [Bacillus sp. AFS077874]PFM81859.1 VanZ family protein [Bacillus sp. AFS077874]
MNKFIKIILLLLFCFYLMILTERILFKYLPVQQFISHFEINFARDDWRRSNNFIPFKTIIFYLLLADINFDIRISNLAGNIIGFMPFGFLLPLIVKKYDNLKSILKATFILSLTYELLQLLLFQLGSFDVDDLILNTLGGGLGYLVLKIIRLVFDLKNKQRVNTSRMN